MRAVVLFLLTVLSLGCAKVSIQSPENIQKYIEQRACSRAQIKLASLGYDTIGVPCDIAKTTYIEADLVRCDEEIVALGCFAWEGTETEGQKVFNYGITIATRNWGWENTLVHEYCHFLLLYTGHGDWVEVCHTHFSFN